MPELDDNLIFFVSQENGIGTEKLMRKMKIGNRNKFYKFIDKKEEQNIIETKKIGRTRQVFLKSVDKKINSFITTFRNRLDFYEKDINKNLTLLEKNLPLISEKQPMKRIKIKAPKLKLIKKTKSVWQYKTQGTMDDHAMRWNVRAKPRKHLDVILQLLHKLYQESSVLTFGDVLTNDTALIKGYQKRSEKLIQDTCTKIENMFVIERRANGEILKTKIDFTYTINRLRESIYALIYKATWEKELAT